MPLLLIVSFYLFEITLVFGVLAFVLMQGYIIWRGAPYLPSTDRRSRLMVDALALKPGQKAADLGSGNGLLLMEMARRGIEAHGYEINPYLVWLARWNIRRAGLRGKAFVHWKDIWATDLGQFDGLTVYLLPHIMKKMAEKLRRELRPGAKVVVETWKLPHWRPTKIIDGYVFLYKV
jgi:cyclopropane fatty-acyl-phospholipid synthase-like methyltransferase